MDYNNLFDKEELEYLINQDNFKKGLKISLLALNRIPEEGIEAMSINDFIAMNAQAKTITKLFNLQELGLDKELGIGASTPNYEIAYGYLRDNLNCQTRGEGLQLIREAKIPKSIIEEWIDSNFCILNLERDAVIVGYPDLKEKLN